MVQLLPGHKKRQFDVSFPLALLIGFRVAQIMADDHGEANGNGASNAADVETAKSDKQTAKEEKAAKRKALLPFAIVKISNSFAA